MTRARRQWTKPLALTLAAVMLTGCVSTSADYDTGQYASPIGNAPVTSNETPYSRALACVARHRRGKPVPKVAVGQIADYTGKAEADGAGRKLTQGAALMAMSALAKAGISLVERYDTSVAELELKYANNRLIGASTRQDPGYRRILAGQIPGSDFYLVGGITELNYNIRSMGADAFGAGTSTADVKGTIGYKAYVMNIGLDLRLVDTRTLEVVDVISYQKQIVGREVQAGVFDILGTTILDAGAGSSALEPIQLAVRAVVERAVLEMITRLYRMGPETCNGAMGEAGDPLADDSDAPAAGAAPAPGTAPAPAPATEEYSNESRQSPYRGYSDNSGGPSLRGRL
jgi:curli production assembly/transport component CsgG/holdfast attachment protein HfaB